MPPIKAVDGVAVIYLRCKVIVLGLINKLYRIKGKVRKAVCNAVTEQCHCDKIIYILLKNMVGNYMLFWNKQNVVKH